MISFSCVNLSMNDTKYFWSGSAASKSCFMCPQASRVKKHAPPHVDDAARQQRSKTGRLDRSTAMAGEYAQVCVETAKKLGLPVLDLYSLFSSMTPSERTMCLEDGLHLSAWGNQLMEGLLRAKVAEAFPALASRLQVWEIPNWDRLR